VVALPARLEPWQLELCNLPALLDEWIERHGSPLNILDPAPLARNAEELREAAAVAGAELGIFFARKANKALSFVDAAARSGLGIDVASERELAQVLARDVPASTVVVTAAVKPRPLLELCAASGATVVIDNADELTLLADVAERAGQETPIAFRLAPEIAPSTRFGLPASEIVRLVGQLWQPDWSSPLAIRGLHFHLDGYDAADRVAALGETLELTDALNGRGHRVAFADIGGGIPMSYLEDASAWERFWSEHDSALAGGRETLTFEGHALAKMYPYYQRGRRGPWLSDVLRGHVTTRSGRQTVAAALRSRGLELRCEPGRSLLDGCGLTIARVEFRKQRRDGTWLIGLDMNRTQCRSTSDDFLVDPLLVRARLDGETPPAVEGYLVGAYCIERELLTWRLLRFPRGAAVGDIVVFPNTAGYLMHSLESASHQIALARNLVMGPPGIPPFLDAIET
jgi:diaminopimelate decarboxylase